MGGKAAVLLVLGFSIIFLVVGYNFNNVAGDSLDNYFRYYNESNVYNISVSGANMAASEIFFEPSWDEGFTNLSFSGGTLDVYVINPLGSGSATVPDGKVLICHHPTSGNSETYRTILISESALSAHLAHGDVLGQCDANADSSTGMEITIISVGSVEQFGETITKTTVVELRPGVFSQYGYYQGTPSDNIWWNTGDVVYGPMHVQGDLQIANSPIFHGRVTSKGEIEYYDSGDGYWDYQQTGTRSEYQEVGGHWETTSSGRGGRTRTVWVAEYDWVEVAVYEYVWVSTTTADPQFLGGYLSGVDYEISDHGVDDVKEAAYDGGYAFSGQDTVIITFQKDSINYKFSFTDEEGTTVLGTSLTSNGVIYVDDGTLRISGTVSGTYTVGVGSNSASSHNGNIYIDNDIVYNDADSDLLGLVAQNDILITNNSANNSDVNINATMYSEEGGFGAEDYSSRPVSGDINVYGGIIQYERLPVGTFSGNTTVSGFNKVYKFDERLRNISPPFFPETDAFQIVSWFE